MFDVIIVGCGSMGAAAAMYAAQRGHRVLAIDRGSVPNARSSHHGVSRLFRMSTFEHPAYVPLLREARAAWDELSDEHGYAFLEKTGMLLAGPPNAPAVTDSIRACQDNAIDHEVIDAAEISRRHPIFRLPDDYSALWEPDAGCLACERAVEVMGATARACGATILEQTRVFSWRSSPDGVSVTTSEGDHHAQALILTAGAWAGQLLARDLDLTVTRQTQFWLEPPAKATPPDLPAWAFDEPSGFTFGFPLVHADIACKACRHHDGDVCDPNTIDRTVTDADLAPVRAALRRLAPDTRHAHAARQRLPLHQLARRCLHRRSTPGARQRRLRVRLHGSRLQVHPRHREGAGRAGDRRPQRVADRALRRVAIPQGMSEAGAQALDSIPEGFK